MSRTHETIVHNTQVGHEFMERHLFPFFELNYLEPFFICHFFHTERKQVHQIKTFPEQEMKPWVCCPPMSGKRPGTAAPVMTIQASGSCSLLFPCSSSHLGSLFITCTSPWALWIREVGSVNTKLYEPSSVLFTEG